MTNLVVCCDGTWNTPEQMDHGLPAPTNVVKLYNVLVKNDRQRAYYHPGVGTGKGWWDQVVGGGTGGGLDRNIKSAYRWLAGHYAKGDEIFVFGFSRGAYTARSLAGLIGLHGLLDASGLEEDEVWPCVDAIFDAYRNRYDFSNEHDYPFHNVKTGGARKGSTQIHFIGVWDTVGALGIPDDFALLGLLDRPEKYHFHDTKLSDAIIHARHAVALDEKRASFAPTLWTEPHGKTDVKQVWFPGVHGDVGGGYYERDLSDGALKWMLDEAEGCGLEIHENVRDQLRAEPQGILHDSCSGVFKHLKTRPRAAPKLSGDAEERLHPSANARFAGPSLLQGDYWPTSLVAKGEAATRSIFAAERWNRTELYLEEDVEYHFKATGQWVDDEDKFDPDGGHSGGFRFGDVGRFVGSALGEAEQLFESLTKNQQTDFWGSKRFEGAPWFALVGYIASDFGQNERLLPTGETFKIGKEVAFTPKRGGYLYCFANDAWRFYDNNRGSVTLTVTRA